jgi:hypothetical protein
LTGKATKNSIRSLLAACGEALDAEIEAVRRRPSEDVLSDGQREKCGGEHHRYRFATPNASLRYAEEVTADAPGASHPGVLLEFDEKDVVLGFSHDFGDHVSELHIHWENDFVLRHMLEKISRLGRAESDDPDARRDYEGILRLIAPEQANAAFDTPAAGSGHHAGFSDAPLDVTGLHTGSLNERQAGAVAMAVTRPTTFIWGPPGTGKTSTLGYIMANLLERGERVLFVSNTNRAVDVGMMSLLSALGESGLERHVPRITRFGETVLEDASLKRIAFDNILEKHTGPGLYEGDPANNDSPDRGPEKGEAVKGEMAKSVLAYNHTAQPGKPSELDILATEHAKLVREAEQLMIDGFHVSREHRLRIRELKKQIDRLELDYGGRVRARGGDTGGRAGTVRIVPDADWNAQPNEWRNTGKDAGWNPVPDGTEDTGAGSRSGSREMKMISLLAGMRLIGTTLARVCTSDLMDLQQFDAVVIDEASMAGLPYSILMAARARKHLVVTGDPMQLPPIALTDSESHRAALEQDIFTRVAEAESPADLFRWHDRNPAFTCFFDTQYRLNSDLAGIISDVFYEGRLRTGKAGKCGRRKTGTVRIINTEHQNPFITSSGEKGFRPVNELHLQIVVDEVMRLVMADRVDPGEIGVIVPFRSAVWDYRKQLSLRNLTDVEVGTIHTFQGREKQVIIFDTVMSGQSQFGRMRHFSVRPFDEEKNGLSVHRLLNVALSRSRDQLILVADFAHMRKVYRNKFLGRLIGRMVNDTGN